MLTLILVPLLQTSHCLIETSRSDRNHMPLSIPSAQLWEKDSTQLWERRLVGKTYVGYRNSNPSWTVRGCFHTFMSQVSSYSRGGKAVVAHISELLVSNFLIPVSRPSRMKIYPLRTALCGPDPSRPWIFAAIGAYLGAL